jgi:hypothetical protein
MLAHDLGSGLPPSVTPCHETRYRVKVLEVLKLEGRSDPLLGAPRGNLGSGNVAREFSEPMLILSYLKQRRGDLAGVKTVLAVLNPGEAKVFQRERHGLLLGYVTRAGRVGCLEIFVIRGTSGARHDAK